MAVENNNLEAIQLLLSYKANPSKKNRMGDAPFDRAVEKKNLSLLDSLIEGQVSMLSQ